MDSSRVLQAVMDSPSRNPKMEAKLRDLAIAVDKEDFQKAGSIAAELKKALGSDAPEVLETETMMHFLEGK